MGAALDCDVVTDDFDDPDSLTALDWMRADRRLEIVSPVRNCGHNDRMTSGGSDTVDVPVRTPLRKAKACFPDLVARADLVGTITMLTRHGRPAAAVLAVAVLDRLQVELADLGARATGRGLSSVGTAGEPDLLARPRR